MIKTKNDKLDKETKQTIKQLRKYMQDRYLQIVRYLENKNTQNANAEIRFLMKYEPSFAGEIKQLREARELRIRRQQFNHIDMKKTEIEKYMEKLQRDIMLIADNMNQTMSKQTSSDLALKQKLTHHANLKDKLDELQLIQEVLFNLLEAPQEKRPRGRPRKRIEEDAEADDIDIEDEQSIKEEQPENTQEDLDNDKTLQYNESTNSAPEKAED
ncbi:MAG: hypothetical protein IJ301_01550 [Clostridia bacterium]|nr:hypothetical protein [Clostridia bacterium]